MKFIRDELDKLMGKDRDMPLRERQKSKKHFDDRDVCCFYLLDFCPSDLFPGMKNEIYECRKRHDVFYKNQFMNNPNKEQYKIKYEEMLEDYLERMISEVDLKIKRGIVRIEGVLAENDKSKEVLDQISNIDKRIQELAIKAEQLGEEGMIEESEHIMTQIDNLKNHKNEIMQVSEHPLLLKEKNMKICEVCGALQSAQDLEKRITTHYEGRTHKGYAKIREMLTDLKKKRLIRRMKNDELKVKEREYEDRILREKEREMKNIKSIREEDNIMQSYFDEGAYDRKLQEIEENKGNFSKRGRGGFNRGGRGGRGGYQKNFDDNRDNDKYDKFQNYDRNNSKNNFDSRNGHNSNFNYQNKSLVNKESEFDNAFNGYNNGVKNINSKSNYKDDYRRDNRESNNNNNSNYRRSRSRSFDKYHYQKKEFNSSYKKY